MKISRCLLLSGVIAATLFAQTDAERNRFQEIQARHNRGEQISQEDEQFARGILARQKTNQAADSAAFVKEHPPQDATGLAPLPDLGKGMYKGFEGGLYPGGENKPPAAHLKAGLKAAKSVVPLDAEGKPSADGKIVLLSCGMSNTTMEFQVFQKLAKADPSLNPKLVIVD